MPRKPRTYLAGAPCHVVQRGNNRCATFFDDADYQHYLGCLKEATERYHVSLHAYVLMTNHVHLLMTPSDGLGVSRVMQSLGRRYVQYINRQFRRTGTLWEGRQKGSLVQAEHYLLICYRYIELNPMRAAMVTHPGKYRWSSYRWHAYGELDPVICDHELYNRASSFSMPLGNQRFREQLEEAMGWRIGYAARGRPRDKQPTASDPN